MIRTWAADITPLLEKEKYLQYYRKAAGFRQQKADKIVPQEGKASSIGVWILLEMMRREYGVDEHAVFNLSHSGCYALCSIEDSGRADIRLGCDIEGVKQVRLDVARRFFCESESAYIARQESEQKKAEAFYRYWVLKESFMKATRLGMKLGLDEFEIALREGQVPCLVRQPEAFPQTYYFQEYEFLNPHYKIAVCSDCSDISEKIETIIL